MVDLNAYERPPAALSQLFKKLRSLKASEIESSPEILDLQLLGNGAAAAALPDGLCLERRLSCQSLRAAFDQFLGGAFSRQSFPGLDNDGVAVYSHRAVPGE